MYEPPPSARAIPCAETCAGTLVDLFAATGTAVDVAGTPPPRRTVFTVAVGCPHGITWYVEPTAEQHRTWKENNVA